MSSDRPDRPHYRSEVSLRPTPFASDPPSPLHLPADGHAEAPGPPPFGAEEAYRSLLFHGPIFRGIVRIDEMSPDRARGVLKTSSPASCLNGPTRGAWLLDPVLIDSAFQMQVLWARHHWDLTLLPAGVAVCRPVAPRVAGVPLRYELIVNSEGRRPSCLCDHELSGSGFLGGVEGIGSRALNRLAGTCSR